MIIFYIIINVIYVSFKKWGVMLIGGHSTKDEDFINGYRISPTTKKISFACDSLEDILKNSGIKIIKKGYFPFKEAYTNKKRFFVYFLGQK